MGLLDLLTAEPSVYSLDPMSGGAPPEMPRGDQASAFPAEIKTGIEETARALGISPVDLATVISYETGGTFSPTQAGPRTQWGQHRGLIQFGEPQAKEHGVDWDNPIASQLGENGAVASYLRKAGVQPGMGLLDVYSAVNAGAPGLYNRSDANNGGAPGTVRDKVEKQMAGHRAKAEAMFGGGSQSYDDQMATRGATPVSADGFTLMRMPNVQNADVTQAEPQGDFGALFSPERTIPGKPSLSNTPTMPGAIDPGFIYQDGPRPNPSQLDPMVASARPLNPTITAAAERGRGPAADRPARGVVVSEGPAGPRYVPPDLSNSNDAGARDFILRQAGMAPDQQSGGFVVPGGPPQTVGGLGGLGGMPAPAAGASPARSSALMGGGGGFDPGDMLQAFGMSLMTSGRKNPLENFPKLFTALSAASETRNKTAQEHAALATALVSSGMPVEQARLYAMNPTAAQIGLKQITDLKVRQQEAEFNARLNGPQSSLAPASAPVVGMSGKSPPPIDRTVEQPQSNFPSAAPSQAVPGASPNSQTPMPAQGQPGQPAAASQTATIDSGNRTVDVLFGKRAAKVAEYSEMARNLGGAPTDRTKSAVEGRLKALEKDIGQLDKQIETYGPTNDMKEYVYAMEERRKRGEPTVPKEQWSPEEERKRAGIARGGLPEEATSLRKEVQGLPSYKNISQAAPIYKSMMDAVGRDTRASDVNMIYGLAKIMDPTSVVRESEMTVAQAMRTGAAEGTKVRGDGGTASAGMPALAGIIGGPKAALVAAGAQGVKAGANQVMKAADLTRNRQIAKRLVMQPGRDLDAVIDGLAQRLMAQSQTRITAQQARELAQIMVMSQGENAGQGMRRVGGLAGLGGMLPR